MNVRLKAVSLIGGIFALPGSTIFETLKPVFLAFLARLSDRAVEVRMSVLEYVRSCLLDNPFRVEAPEIICKELLCRYSKFILESLTYTVIFNP